VARRVIPASILRLRLAAVLAAQLFDYGTFTLMVERHGIRAEANPIVAHGFLMYGLPMVALAKLALVVLLGSVIVVLGQERPGRAAAPRLAAFVTILAVAGGLLGGISNVSVR
jgi:hypothetical protein